MNEVYRNSQKKELNFFARPDLMMNQLEKPLPPSGFGLRFGWILVLRKVSCAKRRVWFSCARGSARASDRGNSR
jgi:hypothetical protein